MLNVFVESGAIGLLSNLNMDMDSTCLQSAVVELIELPLTCVIETQEDTAEIKVFYRDEMKTNSRQCVSGSFRKGDSLNPEEADKTLVLCLLTAKLTLAWLQREGLLEEYAGMDENTHGVLFANRDGQLEVTLVSGRKRPPMKCTTLLGNVEFCRPYMDEMLDDLSMSLEDKEKAAEAGDAVLMEQLAMGYLNGDGMDQDPQRAVYWFGKLAETGDSNGMFNLALHYAKGFGVERDFRQAAYWMEQAQQHGDEDAVSLVERYRQAALDQKKALEGDPRAQGSYAGMLMSLGGSLEQAGSGSDYEEAFRFASQAAEKGDGEAMWILALAYEHGRGTAQDRNRALEWFCRGAEAGNAPCQHSLGCYHMRGEIVEKDEKKGFSLILASAEQGYGLAMRDAGRCYQFGNGVTDDMSLAVSWYEKYLQTNRDPELEQKVAVFKMLLDQEARAGAPSRDDLPEGYADAMETAVENLQAAIPSIGTALRYLDARVDIEAGAAVFTSEVMGTQYEGRNQRIEHIRQGDRILLVREPENEHNGSNVSVRNQAGESLGNLPEHICNILAPQMDTGWADRITARVQEVTPLSQRSKRAKKALLKLNIQVDIHDAVRSTVCKLAGDQVRTWVQELTVYGCTMPTEHAQLFFELHNRYCGEYDNMDKGENDTSYAGLDNLEEEILAAREQMQRRRIAGMDYSKANADEVPFGTYVTEQAAREPERYGALSAYSIDPYDGLEEILSEYYLGEKHCYWLDQTRVTEEEFRELDGFNHWYEILELYDGTQLPVDLTDEDVVSIFGCGTFAAFADLSYGC